MELRHLRAFRAVARTANFTQAAAELHYAQSSITEQIQALEAELGTKLFDRTGRKLHLTGAGERLVDYADQVLLLVDEARSVIEDNAAEPAGELVIGGLETLCAHRIPSILARYRALHASVRTTVRQGNRGELHDGVLRGEVDVAFTFGPPPDGAAFGSLRASEDRLVVAVPPGHRLGRSGPLDRADLRDEPFLATRRGCGFREMFDRSLDGTHEDGPRLQAEVDSIAALCACVAGGMGLALLPEMVVRGPAERGELVAVPMRDPLFRTVVTVTWLRRREHRPGIAAFLALARADAASTLTST